MKRICAVLILVSLSLLPLSALSLSVGLDAASLLSFAYDTVGINAEAGIDIGDHFRTTLSAGFYSTSSMTDDVKFISAALSADYFPFDINEGVEPVYVELPGWKTDMTKMTSEDEFPEEFNAYISFLEEQLETPIKIVSVGPDRAQTIVRYTEE